MAYSHDLRIRVIRAVAADASCREAARLFEVSASTAIKWVERWRRTGSVAAKPRRGGRRSKLTEHRDWLLGLIGERPELTLEEIRGLLRARGVSVGIGSVWRFFDRQGISFKKNGARGGTGQRGRAGGTRQLERGPGIA